MANANTLLPFRCPCCEYIYLKLSAQNSTQDDLIRRQELQQQQQQHIARQTKCTSLLIRDEVEATHRDWPGAGFIGAHIQCSTQQQL